MVSGVKASTYINLFLTTYNELYNIERIGSEYQKEGTLDG